MCKVLSGLTLVQKSDNSDEPIWKKSGENLIFKPFKRIKGIRWD